MTHAAANVHLPLPRMAQMRFFTAVILFVPVHGVPAKLRENVQAVSEPFLGAHTPGHARAHMHARPDHVPAAAPALREHAHEDVSPL